MGPTAAYQGICGACWPQTWPQVIGPQLGHYNVTAEIAAAGTNPRLAPPHPFAPPGEISGQAYLAVGACARHSTSAACQLSTTAKCVNKLWPMLSRTRSKQPTVAALCSRSVANWRVRSVLSAPAVQVARFSREQPFQSWRLTDRGGLGSWPEPSYIEVWPPWL